MEELATTTTAATLAGQPQLGATPQTQGLGGNIVMSRSVPLVTRIMLEVKCTLYYV